MFLYRSLDKPDAHPFGVQGNVDMHKVSSRIIGKCTRYSSHILLYNSIHMQIHNLIHDGSRIQSAFSIGT